MNYMFHGVYITGHNDYKRQHDLRDYTIDVKKITGCCIKINTYADDKDEYYRYYDIVMKFKWVLIYFREPFPEFEAMFPEFPYDESKCKQSIKEYNITRLCERVAKLEKQIDILVSHMEAVMTVLHQRLPTDEPLTL